MSSGDFIRLENLSKTYLEGEARRTVLDQVSATILPGEFIAILGRSGSGKSTLLNLLSGIDEPDSGKVILDGEDILALGDRDRTLYRRRNIGFIFQFFNLIPTLTVWENTCLPLDLVLEANGREDRYKPAEDLLSAVGMLERRDSYPDRLSGGEQQRVAVARALVHDPKLILADEPTGNLDEENGNLVLDLLERLTREAERNLFLVTHSRRAAARADRIFVLHGGRLEPTSQL
jgi:putative ABC transport system ATP-binding protein